MEAGKLGVRPLQGRAGTTVWMLGPVSACGRSSWELGCRGRVGRSKVPGPPAARAQGDRGGLAGTQGMPCSLPIGGDAL